MRILIKNQQNCRRLNEAKIKKAVKKILSLLKRPAAELSILFVDDKNMKRLNVLFRGMSKTTDVLSFPQIEFRVKSLEFRVKNKIQNLELNSSLFNHHSSLLLGDIVINLNQAERQAKKHKLSFYCEIYRLLIHGTLHLLGYDHVGSTCLPPACSTSLPTGQAGRRPSGRDRQTQFREKVQYKAKIMRKKEQEIFNAVKKIY